MVHMGVIAEYVVDLFWNKREGLTVSQIIRHDVIALNQTAFQQDLTVRSFDMDTGPCYFCGIAAAKMDLNV